MAAEPDQVMAPRGAFAAMAWFFQNSLDIFLAVQGHQQTKANDAWKTLTGWESPEVLGHSFWAFVHPDDVERARAAIDGLTTRQRCVVEHRVSTAGGGWLWMRSHAVGGDDGWALIILRDITAERHQAEEGEKATRTAGLLRESAGVTIWRYDPVQDRYDLNPDFTRPVGAIDEDWQADGETVRAAIHRDDAAKLDRAWRDTLATGRIHITEYRERTAEKVWRHIRTAHQGIRQLESGQWQVIGLSQDVTDLVGARDAAMQGEQAALAAAAAKTQFLANMSHELRTPMNGVLGVLHLLKRDPDGQGRSRLLDEALASGIGLSEILNDIVDYSDVEAGRLQLKSEPVNPAAELESVLALLRPRAEAKGLTLNVSAGGDLGWVRGDGVHLRKIFFHLISNAVKFTLRGHVDVTLAAEGVGDRRRLTLIVQDTGIGISAAGQTRLFKEFSQVDPSSTRRFGGPGLGLVVTRSLAELMGGDVSVNSVEGEGSTFRAVVSAPACAAPQEGDGDRGWLAGLRVLVVEDNPTNRLVATAMLGQLGADVETADDGAQGVAAVERTHFDIIFMDIQMPVMDGVEATRRIRAMSEPKCSIPIVATTANVMPEQIATYRRSGINGVVAKPISPTTLLAEVARIANDATQAPAAARA